MCYNHKLIPPSMHHHPIARTKNALLCKILFFLPLYEKFRQSSLLFLTLRGLCLAERAHHKASANLGDGKEGTWV